MATALLQIDGDKIRSLRCYLRKQASRKDAATEIQIGEACQEFSRQWNQLGRETKVG